MFEVWIGPNRRVLWFGVVLPILMLTSGGLCLVAGFRPQAHPLWFFLGGFLCILGIMAIFAIREMLSLPRLAYTNGTMLVYLSGNKPESVPVEYVECFFRGQAEGLLRGSDGQEMEVTTVVVRLAESARDFHHRDVKPALGLWCEGYITLRGTWCEPITPPLLRRLNERLVEIQRTLKKESLEKKHDPTAC